VTIATAKLWLPEQSANCPRIWCFFREWTVNFLIFDRKKLHPYTQSVYIFLARTQTKITAQNVLKHHFKWKIIFSGEGPSPFLKPLGGYPFPTSHRGTLPTSHSLPHQVVWIRPSAPRIPARSTPQCRVAGCGIVWETVSNKLNITDCSSVYYVTPSVHSTAAAS